MEKDDVILNIQKKLQIYQDERKKILDEINAQAQAILSKHDTVIAELISILQMLSEDVVTEQSEWQTL